MGDDDRPASGPVRDRGTQVNRRCVSGFRIAHFTHGPDGVATVRNARRRPAGFPCPCRVRLRAARFSAREDMSNNTSFDWSAVRSVLLRAVEATESLMIAGISSRDHLNLIARRAATDWVGDATEASKLLPKNTKRTAELRRAFDDVLDSLRRITGFIPEMISREGMSWYEADGTECVLVASESSWHRLRQLRAQASGRLFWLREAAAQLRFGELQLSPADLNLIRALASGPAEGQQAWANRTCGRVPIETLKKRSSRLQRLGLVIHVEGNFSITPFGKSVAGSEYTSV